MKSETISWVSSFSPTVGAALAAALLFLPLAVDAVASTHQPEWTERMFDRLAGPAGATILGVVVIYFMFKILMELIAGMKEESATKDKMLIRKDETIAALIDKVGRQ